MLPIDLFYRGARQAPDAIAAEDADTALTYRDLAEKVDALASGLQQLAPEAGRRVGICAPNTLEHLISILAVLAAGHTWVPLNPRNGKAETDAIIAATRPVIVIADASCLDRFATTAARLVVSRPQPGEKREQSIAGLLAEFRGKQQSQDAPPH